MFHQNVSMRGPSFLCPTWNFDQSASIPRDLSCPKKVLVAHLLFLFSHILYILSYTSFIQSSFLYSVWHTMREDIVPQILSCNRFRHKLNNENAKYKDTENRQKQSPRGVLFKNFLKFKGKHLCKSFFFNKVAGWGLPLYQKIDSVTGAFLWVLRNF